MAANGIGRAARFDASKALKGLLDKLDMALDRGFEGLRAAGRRRSFLAGARGLERVCCLRKRSGQGPGSRRMLVLCPYPLDKCGPREIIDAAANHEFALIRGGEGWQVRGKYRAPQN